LLINRPADQLFLFGETSKPVNGFQISMVSTASRYPDKEEIGVFDSHYPHPAAYLTHSSATVGGNTPVDQQAAWRLGKRSSRLVRALRNLADNDLSGND